MFRRRAQTRPIEAEPVWEPEWPAGVPRLYPNLTDEELSRFLTEEQYLDALAFPRVLILPFGSANRSVREQLVGMGLSRLLIRDLMLVRNVSIRGPEDTPNDFPDDPEVFPDEEDEDVIITGQMEMADGGRFSARLWVHQVNRPAIEIAVPQADLADLVEICRRELVRALKGEINPRVEQRWETGRPSSFELLQDFGQLCLAKDDALQSEHALSLWKREPEFVLPLHLVGVREHLLRGMEFDPNDAQLFFLLFLAFWESAGPQPEAVQFLRRAILLSPGHGKAHMCAPHAADPQVDMLKHSELGYRLLPGNPFAINNYVIYLQNAGKTEDLKQLAHEGIETDPYDHGSYDRLIEIYEAEGDYEKALRYARKLQELYGPPMHPRTRVCLQQNPKRAADLEAGWDPADDLKRTIRRIHRLSLGENVEIVQLTPIAAKELKRSLKRERMPKDTRIRVTAWDFQTGDPTYRLDFDQEYDPRLDMEFQSQGLWLIVQRNQLELLEDTLVDYEPGRDRFMFENPNVI